MNYFIKDIEQNKVIVMDAGSPIDCVFKLHGTQVAKSGKRNADYQVTNQLQTWYFKKLDKEV